MYPDPLSSLDFLWSSSLTFHSLSSAIPISFISLPIFSLLGFCNHLRRAPRFGVRVPRIHLLRLGIWLYGWLHGLSLEGSQCHQHYEWCLKFPLKE